MKVLIMNWIVSPLKMHRLKPLPNIIVFGDGVFKGVTKVKWERKDGALVQ